MLMGLLDLLLEKATSPGFVIVEAAGILTTLTLVFFILQLFLDSLLKKL